MNYEQAVRYLCGDPALRNDDEDRRDEARDVITDAVGALVKEEGGGKGELRDWIAEGDWSPAQLNQLEAWSAEALAAEWDNYQREARRALEN